MYLSRARLFAVCTLGTSLTLLSTASADPLDPMRQLPLRPATNRARSLHERLRLIDDAKRGGYER